jgi:hypothetical protein
MKKLLLLLSIAFLFGCHHYAPISVITETKQGEALTMTPIQETASRKDIPVDVAPREVIAKVETKTGAKVYVVKKFFFRPPVVYQNEQAKAEGITIAQPKDPWWKWPLAFGIVLAVAAGLYFLDRIKSILFFWRK